MLLGMLNQPTNSGPFPSTVPLSALLFFLVVLVLFLSFLLCFFMCLVFVFLLCASVFVSIRMYTFASFCVFVSFVCCLLVDAVSLRRRSCELMMMSSRLGEDDGPIFFCVCVFVAFF